MMQLRVGDVLHVYMPVLVGGPKHKYIVLVCCDAPMRCVLINTENAADVLQSDELAPTQVALDAQRHSFLKHDSWIDGHELFGIPEADLIAAVNDGELRGRVCVDILRALQAAIDVAPTIAGRQKQRVLDSITAELEIPSPSGLS